MVLMPPCWVVPAFAGIVLLILAGVVYKGLRRMR